jgi:hypothetical protein
MKNEGDTDGHGAKFRGDWCRESACRFRMPAFTVFGSTTG